MAPPVPLRLLSLSLSLLLLLLASAAAQTPHAANDLRLWLQDAGSRRTLLNAFGGNTRPLQAALRAAPAPADAAAKRCHDDIQHVLDSATASVPNFSALQMLDASVKVPEGILVASWIHLGNWDECVAVRDQHRPAAASERFHGQMCSVTLSPNITGSTSKSAGEEQQLLRAAADETGALVETAAVQLAVCVPSSCSASHVQELFGALLADASEAADKTLPLKVTVQESDCTTKDTPALDALDWTVVGVLIALGALVVASTAYDVLVSEERKMPLLAAFSVVTNGRKLMAVPRPGGDTTLSCLHGIRFLSMCWVVLGHRYFITMNLPNLNPGFMLTFMQDWRRVGITNATVSVDTFFLISGLLVSYLFFRQAPSKRKLNLPLYYIHRYIRLTPAYAMMILLSASVIFRMGWGPRWSTLTDPTREACQKSWWNSLLYVNNYVDPAATCVGQSWYLMVDMQLYWLSPLLLLPIARWPRAGLPVLVLLSAVGIGVCFAVSYVYKMPGNIFSTTDPDASTKYFRNYYVPAYTRFVPYVEGLALGLVLGNRQALGLKPRPLGWVTSVLAWLSVAALMLVPLFVGHQFLKEPVPSNVAAALYNALHRPAWALGVGGVVFLCANGNGGPANRLLSWTGFQVLGRLSYCVYLVHMSVQAVETASARTYTYMSDGVILPAFASDLLVSFLLAAALSLLCEAPFMVLEKELLGGAKKRAAPPAEKAASNVA